MFPGRLSVSRTFGDIEAKLEQFGGNSKVIVSEPEIRVHDIHESNDDFFVLGCDGIFDRMTNNETVGTCWKAIEDKRCTTYHQELGVMVD